LRQDKQRFDFFFESEPELSEFKELEEDDDSGVEARMFCCADAAAASSDGFASSVSAFSSF
jgi:hypothetical protein